MNELFDDEPPIFFSKFTRQHFPPFTTPANFFFLSFILNKKMIKLFRQFFYFARID